MRHLLRSFAGNERGPAHARVLLTALALAVGKRPLTLLLASQGAGAALGIELPDAVSRFAQEAVLAQYPEALTERVAEPAATDVSTTIRQYLRLIPEFEPLVTLAEVEDRLARTLVDPAAALLQAVTLQNSSHYCELRLELRPASEARRRSARRLANQMADSFWKRRPRLADWYVRQRAGSWWRRTFTAIGRRSSPISVGRHRLNVQTVSRVFTDYKKF